MRIVVNHLTRMRGDHICVAGLDLDTRGPVRPVSAAALTQKMLKRHGGVFDIAEVVDLGEVRRVGEAPEVEDHRFDLANLRAVGPMPMGEFWALLSEVARPTLAEIFGEDLERRGHTYATEAGRGIASLGCVAIPSQLVPRLSYPYGKLRLSLPDEQADVAVTVKGGNKPSASPGCPRLRPLVPLI